MPSSLAVFVVAVCKDPAVSCTCVSDPVDGAVDVLLLLGVLQQQGALPPAQLPTTTRKGRNTEWEQFHEVFGKSHCVLCRMWDMP